MCIVYSLPPLKVLHRPDNQCFFILETMKKLVATTLRDLIWTYLGTFICLPFLVSSFDFRKMDTLFFFTSITKIYDLLQNKQ
jgi:hypothetical protein